MSELNVEALEKALDNAAEGLLARGISAPNAAVLAPVVAAEYDRLIVVMRGTVTCPLCRQKFSPKGYKIHQGMKHVTYHPPVSG